jgi:hypothetical protein
LDSERSTVSKANRFLGENFYYDSRNMNRCSSIRFRYVPYARISVIVSMIDKAKAKHWLNSFHFWFLTSLNPLGCETNHFVQYYSNKSSQITIVHFTALNTYFQIEQSK